MIAECGVGMRTSQLRGVAPLLSVKQVVYKPPAAFCVSDV